MINGYEATLISNLAAAVGKSAEFVTSEYAAWMIWSSVAWILVGCIVLVGGLKMKFDDDSKFADWGKLLFKGSIVFLGAMIVAANVPDLAQPKAAAIHKLINDVKK